MTRGARARGFEQLRKTVLDTLASAGVHSVGRSGFGAGCTEAALFVHLTSWSDLDPAIRALGILLHERGLREPLTICVTRDEARLIDSH